MAGEMIYADGQLEFNGYLLGDEENTFLDAINGWDDLPGIDSGTTLRPSSHGAWSGMKFAGIRIITWEGRFSPERAEWSQELERLMHVFTVPEGTEEYPIVVRLHNDIGVAYGSVSARALPGDRQYGYYGANLSIQFECSDPRRYSLGTNTWTLSLPEVLSDGLTYPLEYPLDYGQEIPPSVKTLYNTGNVSTPLILTLKGPVTNPMLTNSTTGLKLKFNITLSDTDSLVINTRTGTVLLNDTADRLYTRSFDSAPITSFNLKSGANTLSFSAESWNEGAEAVIEWKHAIL